MIKFSRSSPVNNLFPGTAQGSQASCEPKAHPNKLVYEITL